MSARLFALYMALYALSMALACTPTQPTPTPVGPPTGDLFAVQHIFNCRLPVVAVERDSAMIDVRACLLDGTEGAVTACTIEQAGQYNPATVACLVRDVGARANSAALAGTPDPNDAIVAEAARRWISSHNVGYVSVEVSP